MNARSRKLLGLSTFVSGLAVLYVGFSMMTERASLASFACVIVGPSLLHLASIVVRTPRQDEASTLTGNIRMNILEFKRPRRWKAT